MFVVYLIITLFDCASVENDAFCDVEIVLRFLWVVHLEAKSKKLKVKSSNKIIDEVVAIFYLFYYLVVTLGNGF